MLKNDVGLIRCLRIVGLSGDWMNLGPGVGLIAPAGIVGGFNTPGSVYFVDIFNGDNANNGITPDTPFQTIAFALTQCVADNDDYIIVLDAWNEATPIAINVTRVHILGLSANPSRLYPVMNASAGASADSAVFTISSTCNLSEIAGLDLGGGATHAAIENVAGTPMGVYIHHCIFGSLWSGDTPQDGIRIGTNATALRVEACKLLGTSIDAQGALTRDGIHFAAAANSQGGDIVCNIFQGIPDVAINILSHGEALVIKRNEFTVEDLANGEAITLAAATCAGIMVDDNAAMNGNAQINYAFNPYRDLNGGNNHWGRNYRGNAVIEPVIA